MNARVVDAVDLQIDEQVNKLLELSHQLTYFIVTASVTALAFTINLLASHDPDLLDSVDVRCWLLVAAVLALSTVALSLLALTADIKSFRYHLRFRYERKSLDDVPAETRKDWDRTIAGARSQRTLAFWLLVGSVAVEVLLVTFAL